MLAPNCVGDYCSWAEIPANSTKSFTLIYAVYGPISNYSIDSLSLDNNPTPPIQKPGKIQLNLDTKNISDICNKGLCNFAINLKSNGFESIINFDNTQDTYTIQNLNAGNYTFSVTNIPGDINIEFQPKDTISVSPNNISNETIVFKHAEPSKINLTVKLNNIDDKEASSLKPILKLIDINNSKYNANCIITIGNICTFNNMKANDTYQINLQGVGNASSGNYYTYTGESFVLNSSITKEISYDKVTNNLKSVTFLVNGLNSDATTPNVVFTEDDEGSNFLYAQNQLNSGTYTFVIDHNIAINPVDTPNGYTFESVTPNMIHVDNNPNQVIVNYSKNSPTPPTKGGILAGYLSTGYMGPSNNYVTIGQAAQIGYNVVILAFAKVDDSENISFYNNGGIGILAYDNGIGSSKCINDATQYMINDIKTAKEKYNLKYVLASFGGGNSTISRSSFNNIDILAANMITFKNKYHLDGFDFDLEIQIDANNLDQLLKKLKKLDPSIILSAAPQMNTIDPTAKNKYLVDLVTTGYYQDYDIAVNNGDFDYIWAQAYNTGSATNLIKYSNNDIDETMSDYIIAAFSYFTTNQAGNNYIKIPNNTTFILGEPATKEDAGVATVWNNNQYSDVYNALLNGYSKLSSPNAMTWTINRDISIGNCKFTKTLSPLITGKQIPDSLCPTNTDKYWANVCSNN
jgi:chitinase